MNFSNYINLIATLLCLAFAIPEEANVQKKLGQFANWVAVKGSHEGEEFCYAYSIPSSSFSNNAQAHRNSYFLVVWHGKNQFSFSTHLDFQISKKYPIFLNINDNEVFLKNSAPFNGITYSSMQDSQILKELIENSNIFKIKTWDIYGQVNTDYYKTDGLLKGLSLMQNNCK